MCHPKLTLVKAGVPFNGVGEMNRVVVNCLTPLRAGVIG